MKSISVQVKYIIIDPETAVASLPDDLLIRELVLDAQIRALKRRLGQSPEDLNPDIAWRARSVRAAARRRPISL